MFIFLLSWLLSLISDFCMFLFFGVFMGFVHVVNFLFLFLFFEGFMNFFPYCYFFAFINRLFVFFIL